MPNSLTFIVPHDEINSKIKDIVTLVGLEACPKNLKIYLPEINTKQACKLGMALVGIHWESLWLIIDKPYNNDVYFELMFKTCVRGDHLFLCMQGHPMVKSVDKPLSVVHWDRISSAIVFSKNIILDSSLRDLVTKISSGVNPKPKLKPD